MCGGYTSQGWGNVSGTKVYNKAFVFNLKTKYNPNNYDCEIYEYGEGFAFGDDILTVTAE